MTICLQTVQHANYLACIITTGLCRYLFYKTIRTTLYWLDIKRVQLR